MNKLIAVAVTAALFLTGCGSNNTREVTEQPNKVAESAAATEESTDTSPVESTEESVDTNEARETLKNLMVLGARAEGDEITDEFAYCVIDAMKEGTGLEYDELLSELIADEDFIGEGEIGIMLLTCFAEFGDEIEDFFEDEEPTDDMGDA